MSLITNEGSHCVAEMFDVLLNTPKPKKQGYADQGEG